MSLVKRFYINKADCSVYDSRWAMGKAAAELTASNRNRMKSICS